MFGVLSWESTAVGTLLMGVFVFVCLSVAVMRVDTSTADLLSFVAIGASLLMAAISLAGVNDASLKLSLATTLCNAMTGITCPPDASATLNGVVVLDLRPYYNAVIVQEVTLVFTSVLLSIIAAFLGKATKSKKVSMTKIQPEST